ncbi:MAG: hypothetical protein KGL35_28895 [Bradyrhizobium sp.]|nr:hypothetical protein [Pseudomonadota bacterium]MDE2472636.1 hypothetical protein [Bradyrhizobium sp.]
MIVVGIFVARDRRRAELLLFALTAISTLTAIALLIARSGLIESLFRSETNEMLSSLSSLGVILWLAIGVRFIERQEAKEAKTQRPRQDMQRLLALTGAGLLICIAGLAAAGTLNTALVVVFGALVFGSIQAIRRIDLAGWGTGTSVVTLIAAAAMVILWRYDNVRALSPFLRFATSASADSIAVAQRMLSDAGWKGIGAGAYALLVPVYQELGVSAPRAPSTGATFAIELGWPIALFAIAATIGLVIILFRGALVRGRDSFYPAAAAACTVTVLGQAFCDTSLLHSSIAIVVDLVVALGLAQSKSQATGR